MNNTTTRPEQKAKWHSEDVPIRVAMCAPATPLYFVEAYVYYDTGDRKGIGSRVLPVVCLRTVITRNYSKKSERYPYAEFHTPKGFERAGWQEAGFYCATEAMILDDGMIRTERDCKFDYPEQPTGEWESQIVVGSQVEKVRTALERKLADKFELYDKPLREDFAENYDT